MQVLLSGSGSAPSGLPLTYSWTRLSGPAVTINNPTQPLASFTATMNVTALTTLEFQLRVNDTRVDTDDTAAVELYPMVDSDSDGLSDQEELTGNDNSLTAADPAGITTDPNRADSDGDGMSDGDEAIAGTDPYAADSVFRVLDVQWEDESVTVVWSSVAGRIYQVQTRESFSSQWNDVGEPVTASSNTAALPIPTDAAKAFYRVLLTGRSAPRHHRGDTLLRQAPD